MNKAQEDKNIYLIEHGTPLNKIHKSHRTYKVCLNAVELNGWDYFHVPGIYREDKEIKKAALRRNIRVSRRMRKPYKLLSTEQMLEAVKYTPYLIKHIPVKLITDEIVFCITDIDPGWLKWIRNTEYLQKVFDRDKKVIIYMNPEFISEKMIDSLDVRVFNVMRFESIWLGKHAKFWNQKISNAYFKKYIEEEVTDERYGAPMTEKYQAIPEHYRTQHMKEYYKTYLSRV